MKTFFKSRFLISCFAVLLSGCVLRQEQPLNSRYLGDYTGFQQVDFKAETLVYRHPTTRVTDYNKFMIAPVIVYENAPKIKESNRPFYDDLADELHSKLVGIISKNYSIVKDPGPGVLLLEYAIVDIKPYTWMTKEDGTRYFRTDTTRKGSQFELDCRDSQSDERIFAISTRYVGKTYMAYANMSCLPNIQTAFDQWARFLDSLLARAKQDRAAARQEDAASFRPATSSYRSDPKNPGAVVYRHPKLRVTNYEKFYVPVPRLEGRPNMTADERKEIGLKLRDEAILIFDDPSLFVNHPGPGILTVRTRIEESPTGHKFTLECIDPAQGTLVFGMIQTVPGQDLFKAYKKWNEKLKERWEEALEAKP